MRTADSHHTHLHGLIKHRAKGSCWDQSQEFTTSSLYSPPAWGQCITGAVNEVFSESNCFVMIYSGRAELRLTACLNHPHADGYTVLVHLSVTRCGRERRGWPDVALHGEISEKWAVDFGPRRRLGFSRRNKTQADETEDVPTRWWLAPQPHHQTQRASALTSGSSGVWVGMCPLMERWEKHWGEA